MAGPYYVRSTDGSDASDGLTWANAKATLAGAFTAGAAGDTIYVSQNHAETQATNMTLTSPGTAAAPCLVVCVNDANEPPTAVATTGAIDVNGTSSSIMAFEGFAYVYGITFKITNTSNAPNFQFDDYKPWFWRLESCELALNRVTVVGYIDVGNSGATSNDDQCLELINTTVSGVSAANTFRVRSQLVWRGGDWSGTAPTTLITPAASYNALVCISAVDLSVVTDNLVDLSGLAPHRLFFNNCKLGSGVTIGTGSVPGQGGTAVELVNCDSADTNYRYHRQTYQGTITHETTIVRTGGASDGTTPISRKMVSSANSQFFSPLELGSLAVWNETTGSSVTATIEIITDNVTLTDAECWLEVEYLGTSGFPLSLFANDRAADILATPANQASSSVTWTTTGLGTPLKQKLSVSFTPQEKGPIKVRVMLAKASTTVYVCPKIEIT